MAQSTIKITTTRPGAALRPTPARRWLRGLAPIITLLVVLGLWQLVVILEIYPRFIIPAPLEVFERFTSVLADGTLLRHVLVTLREMLYGLAIGVSAGLIVGYLIAKNQLLEDLLSPVIVAFQSTPIVAYAPLLIIWFGNGLLSKVLTGAVIVFFPMLMNVIVGTRQVPHNMRELMRSLNATPLQTFLKLELPAALPVLLTGLKTSVTLAVIGAVVGEFISASEGLGFLVVSARSRFDTALVFVAVLTMTALALTLYSSVALLERRLLRWQKRSGQ